MLDANTKESKRQFKYLTPVTIIIILTVLVGFGFLGYRLVNLNNHYRNLKSFMNEDTKIKTRKTNEELLKRLGELEQAVKNTQPNTQTPKKVDQAINEIQLLIKNLYTKETLESQKSELGKSLNALEQQINLVSITPSQKRDIADHLKVLKSELENWPQILSVESEISLHKDIINLDKDYLGLILSTIGTLVSAIGGLFFFITAYLSWLNFKSLDNQQISEKKFKNVLYWNTCTSNTRLTKVNLRINYDFLDLARTYKIYCFNCSIFGIRLAW
jgi:predicted PurR-regulated permease PerM